ncbi:MAG TPA: hypothetical protein VF026_26625 [Ktedonobacteraceae bacterium]
MNKHQLAAQLRQRQLSRPDSVRVIAGDEDGRLPYEQALAKAQRLVAQLSDDDIIDSYIHCSHCSALMVDKRINATLMWRAHDTQEWIDLTAEWARRHTEKGEQA